jgi:hypothetical protein
LSAGTPSGATGNRVQPGSEQVLLSDGRRFSRQREKDRLKGVLAVLLVLQDSAANGEDHRAMISDEDFEGGSVPTLNEPLQGLFARDSSIMSRHDFQAIHKLGKTLSSHQSHL